MVKAPATDTNIALRLVPIEDSELPEREMRGQIKKNINAISGEEVGLPYLNNEFEISMSTTSLGGSSSRLDGIDLVFKSPFMPTSELVRAILAVDKGIHGLDVEVSGIAAPEEKAKELEDFPDDPEEFPNPLSEDIGLVDQYKVGIISAEPTGKIGGPRPFMQSRIAPGTMVFSEGDSFSESDKVNVRNIPELEDTRFISSEIENLPAQYFLKDSDELRLRTFDTFLTATGNPPLSAVIGISERFD